MAAAVGTIPIAAIAVWQSRLFVTYQGSRGIFDVQGGGQHLWLAIGAALMACIAAVLMFFFSLRYDDKGMIFARPKSA